MTDLEEIQRTKIERLYGEIEKWKTKYFEQIKTDEEWERYIKKSREEAEEQRKRDSNYVVLGITWIATLMYLLFFGWGLLPFDLKNGNWPQDNGASMITFQGCIVTEKQSAQIRLLARYRGSITDKLKLCKKYVSLILML